MSFSILKQIGDAQKKKAVVDVRSGDTVKVTQKIKEGEKFDNFASAADIRNILRPRTYRRRGYVL